MLNLRLQLSVIECQQPYTSKALIKALEGNLRQVSSTAEPSAGSLGDGNTGPLKPALALIPVQAQTNEADISLLQS